MEPLFPDDRPMPPPLPEGRWLRSTATLGAERRVLSVQVDLIAQDGTVLMSRGYYPPPGQTGSLDPIGAMCRDAWLLTVD